MLLESDRIALPFTFTWARPVILLPATLCDAGEPGALRYVLAHEWSHVERRDAWAWNLACLAGLVLFYQPLFWWLRRQLRLCQDYLADARAAAAGSAEDYAAYLVRLARVRALRAVLAGPGDRRPALEPVPEGRHARAGPRTAGAPLPDRLEPCRRRDRGRRHRRRLGAPPRRRRAADDKPAAKEAKAVKTSRRRPGDPKPAGRRCTTRASSKTRTPASRSPGPRWSSAARSSGPARTGCSRRPGTPPTRTARTASRSPPNRSPSAYLYIELDVEHPEYATRAGFGYALSMIRKNEGLGERPFFETIELRPAKPITGRVETPEGSPAAGVELLAYSAPTSCPRGRFEYGSFAKTKTDADGKFRLPITTPGQGVFWVLPKEYAPSCTCSPTASGATSGRSR